MGESRSSHEAGAYPDRLEARVRSGFEPGAKKRRAAEEER